MAEGRELVKILLAAGADPTAQDAQHKRTALHTAVMVNDVDLVKVNSQFEFVLCIYISWLAFRWKLFE